MAAYPRDLEEGQRVVGNLKPYEWAWVEQSAVKYTDDGNWYLDPRAPFHSSSTDSALDARWRFEICKRHPEKFWVFPDTSRPLGFYCLVPRLANNNAVWQPQAKQRGWVPVSFLERLPIIDRFNNMSWMKVAFFAVGILITIDGVLGNPFKDQFNLLINLVAGGSPLLARAVVPVATQFVHAQIIDAEQTAQDDAGKVVDDDEPTVDRLKTTPPLGGPAPKGPSASSRGPRVIPLWNPQRRTDLEDDQQQIG